MGSQGTGASARELTYILLDGLFSSPRAYSTDVVCVWVTWQKAHCQTSKVSLKGFYEEPHGICNLITKLVPLRT